MVHEMRLPLSKIPTLRMIVIVYNFNNLKFSG